MKAPVAVFACAISLAVCGCSLGSLQAANPTVSSPKVYDYTAIGASDAVGFGASHPCATSAVTIGADTELLPTPASCPGGTGYVPASQNRLYGQNNRLSVGAGYRGDG